MSAARACVNIERELRMPANSRRELAQFLFAGARSADFCTAARRGILRRVEPHPDGGAGGGNPLPALLRRPAERRLQVPHSIF